MVPTAITSLASLTILTISYIIYQRYFHHLSKYPGPFLASLTNLWKAYQVSTLHLPYILADLHEKHGPVLRIGPNTLSFADPEAIAPIYNVGRTMAKTGFYDAFTAINPNTFGTQDEDLHAIRRRQMAYAFTMPSIKKMEVHLDKNIEILRSRLDRAAESNQAFSLRDYLHHYIIDVLGELAFSRSFETQTSTNPDLPPVKDHVLLATIMGQVPSTIAVLRKVLVWLPIPWLRRLFASRARLRELAIQCVSRRLEKRDQQRVDLLSCLIEATDPETGMKLRKVDIDTEAFGFIIAGTHSTSGTLQLLFWHLLHSPKDLQKCIKEIEAKLGSLPATQQAYPVEDLETKLEYLNACIKENSRMDAVFNMPLPRVVMSPVGADIAGHHIPYGTEVSVTNHCAHHHAPTWGADHNNFDPSRWLDSRAEGKAKYLIPFSVGHRSCLGKTIAITNMLKVTSTLFAEYEFEVLDQEVRPDLVSVGLAEMEGKMLCRVRKRG